MGIVMNEFDDWWVVFLAKETEKARQRAERLFPSRVVSNVEKRIIFMETFHWALLEARTEMWKLYFFNKDNQHLANK